MAREANPGFVDYPRGEPWRAISIGSLVASVFAFGGLVFWERRVERRQPWAEDLLLYLVLAAAFGVLNTSLSEPLISDFGAFLLTFLLPAFLVAAKDSHGRTVQIPNAS